MIIVRTIFAVLLLVPRAVAAQEGENEKLAKLITGAHQQIGITVHYDGSYKKLGYPGGDVATDRGVCTDVLIRAFRSAGIDLQVLVHEDMKREFHAYPSLWGLSRPDLNIDHRRVRNLMTFFKRHGKTRSISQEHSDYEPGDIVAWMLPGGLPHIGIVSNKTTNDSKRRLVVHNIGEGTKLEDILFRYKITGHYRYF